MKNFLLCLAVVFLSSCIPVDDFGSYWQKGYVDPALLGKWSVTTPREDDERKEARSVKVVVDVFQVVNKKGIYQFDSLDEKDRQEKDYSPEPARSLKVGSYMFLMEPDKKNLKKHRFIKGYIRRYKLEGNVLQFCSLVPERTGAFLNKKYPKTKNIRRHVCIGKCMWDGVNIKKLNDEVSKVLSDIPDTKEFWQCDSEYRIHSDSNK